MSRGDAGFTIIIPLTQPPLSAYVGWRSLAQPDQAALEMPAHVIHKRDRCVAYSGFPFSILTAQGVLPLIGSFWEDPPDALEAVGDSPEDINTACIQECDGDGISLEMVKRED